MLTNQSLLCLSMEMDLEIDQSQRDAIRILQRLLGKEFEAEKVKGPRLPQLSCDCEE